MGFRNNPLLRIARWFSLALGGVLVIEIALMLWSTLHHAGAGNEMAGLDGRDVSQIGSLPALDEFQETVDRNLFSWNRKPDSDESDSGPADSSELAEKWRLIGLVNTSESTYAIFDEVDGKRQLRLEQGMELDGWSIDTVDAEKVRLVSGDKRETFRLSVTDMPRVVVAGGEDQETELPGQDSETETKATETELPGQDNETETKATEPEQ